MDNTNNISDELEVLAPVVANLSRGNLYFVPAGYFASLSEHIIARTAIAEFPPGENPYDTPLGYFENLPNAIMQKIHSQKGRSNEIYNELAEVAPLLNSITKDNLFSVPDHYFRNLEISVLQKPIAKVVSIATSFRRGLTYAAAASVLFIVATTSFLYISLHKHGSFPNPGIEQRLIGLKDDEIISYLKDNRDILSGDLITTYAEQDKKIQFILKRTSDDEIQNYLNDYSDGGEKIIKGI